MLSREREGRTAGSRQCGEKCAPGACVDSKGSHPGVAPIGSHLLKSTTSDALQGPNYQQLNLRMGSSRVRLGVGWGSC